MKLPRPDPVDDYQGPNHRFMLTAILMIGLGAGIIFSQWPEIDLWAAALFQTADGGYVLKGPGPGQLLRPAFKAVFIIGGGTVLIGMLLAYFNARTVLGHGARTWLYLMACLIIGPGLIANTLLKDHWGRARPVHVSHHGKIFSPALIPSNQCARNCSFVSGESASIYALFFGLTLMGSRWWRLWLGAGLALGSAAGLMRMAQGGHYLSDVVFSAVIMALVALGLSYLMLRDDTP